MSSLARMIDFTATALFLSQFLHSLINNLREDGIQKGEKRGMANAKMYTFLEQNIVERFVCINEYGHRLKCTCSHLCFNILVKFSTF